jgi:hypothetical protein
VILPWHWRGLAFGRPQSLETWLALEPPRRPLHTKFSSKKKVKMYRQSKLSQVKTNVKMFIGER